MDIPKVLDNQHFTTNNKSFEDRYVKKNNEVF